jgi:hypothetical protein
MQCFQLSWILDAAEDGEGDYYFFMLGRVAEGRSHWMRLAWYIRDPRSGECNGAVLGDLNSTLVRGTEEEVKKKLEAACIDRLSSVVEQTRKAAFK